MAYNDYSETQERNEKAYRNDDDNYTRCNVCDEKFCNCDEEDIEYTHICSSCKEKLMKPETALKVGEKLTEKIEINGEIFAELGIDLCRNIIEGYYKKHKDCFINCAEELYNNNKDEYIEAYKELEVE